jgi:predicted outer membrane repeat protein
MRCLSLAKSLIFFFFLILSTTVFSGTIVVLNTDDEGAGSLRQAVRDAITGDTIRFDETLISSGNATIVLDSSIVYSNKGLTFKGLYNSTDTLKISGNNTNRIFTILQTQRTVIDSLVLFNGYANGALDDPKGGAIFISNGTDTMFFNNSVFYDNVAVGNGGVIHNVDYGGNLHFSINNSTFKNNSGSNGAALFLRSINNNSFVEITDSKFLNNSSDVDGGAIFIKSLENTYLTLLGSDVEENSCGNGYGAGVFLDGVDSELTLESSKLNLNENLSTGSFHGGGAYVYGSDNSTVTINDSEISDNTCLNADNGFGLYVYANLDVNLTVNNSIVDNNSGSGSGAFYAESNLGDLNCSFDSTSFTNNSTTTTGGAMFLTSGGAVSVDFNETVVSNNSSNSHGGAIYMYNAGSNEVLEFSILNSEIDNNTSNVGSGTGMHINADSLIFSLENSSLSSNRHFGSSNEQGGGAYLTATNFNKTTIINSELKFNETPGGGAALITRTSGVSGDTELNVVNSTASNNIGGGIFGAFGVMSSQGNININLINSTFNENTTQNLGGAIYAYAQENSEINVTKSTAFGNSADQNGGFIYLYGGALAEVNIKESTIVGNTTLNQGGAVYCFNSNPTATIKNSIISENTGTDQLYIYNSTTSELVGGISNGFNIFSNNQLGAVFSDQINVTETDLNLQPLALNGETTETMIPGTGSVAINAGDPNNISDAQNGSVVGVRDIGAAEYNACPNAPVINFAITNSSCDETDGAVNTTITGDSPFDVSWSNGADTENISDLAPGTYYLTVIDVNDCEVTAVANVNSNQLTLSGVVTNNVCTDLTAGEIDLTVTGTATPFVYQWTTGASSQDVTNLVAGQYEVIVTDANDCSSSMSFNVEEPDEFLVGMEVIDAGCGLVNGEIDLSVTGGTGNYTIDWQNSMGTSIGATEDLTGLPQGFYTVTIIDENGCSISKSTQISEIGAPVISVLSITNADCTDNGEIDIDIQTAGTILSTTWSNLETTEDITGLAPDTYTVSVEDNNNCISNASIQVLNAIPEAINICLVTVDTLTGTNMVVWEKPISTTIDKFIIYRETSVSGQYLALDTVDYNDDSEYTDPAAFPNLRSWRYKISVVNTCGVESELSLAHKTIHCTISAALGGGFNILWNSYEGFSYSTFEVWRHRDVSGWELLESLSNTNFSLSDNPTSYTGLDYFVSVAPPSTCTSTTRAQDHNASRSNKSSHTTGILIDPTDGIIEYSNSFSVYPNPVNSELYINTNSANNYSINIFDLSGKLVYSNTFSQSSISINLKDLENGAYIVRIISDDAILNKQIVKN